MKKIFFTVIKTGEQDTLTLKIESDSIEEAVTLAAQWVTARGDCSVDQILSRKDFKENYPEEHTAFWGKTPDIAMSR